MRDLEKLNTIVEKIEKLKSKFSPISPISPMLISEKFIKELEKVDEQNWSSRKEIERLDQLNGRLDEKMERIDQELKYFKKYGTFL